MATKYVMGDYENAEAEQRGLRKINSRAIVTSCTQPSLMATKSSRRGLSFHVQPDVTKIFNYSTRTSAQPSWIDGYENKPIRPPFMGDENTGMPLVTTCKISQSLAKRKHLPQRGLMESYENYQPTDPMTVLR